MGPGRAVENSTSHRLAVARAPAQARCAGTKRIRGLILLSTSWAPIEPWRIFRKVVLWEQCRRFE
jgi:hypothetical protein